MDEGLFITFEGIDGAGKSTLVDKLTEELDGQEVQIGPPEPVLTREGEPFPHEDGVYDELEVVTTGEPSDLWTGDTVYRAIGSESETPALTDFFFFMGDRVNHIENRIKPALDDGELVLSDRYADSTMVYQQRTLEGQIDNPKEYMRSLMGKWNLEPDVTIFIDISVETAIRRMDGDDKYENKEFLREVTQNYYELMDENPDRFRLIDGEYPIDIVKDEAKSIILEEISELNG